MEFWHCVKEDWAANVQNPKGRMVTFLFRLAAWFRQSGTFLYVLGWPYIVCYRIWVEWILGVELPPLTKVGPGLTLHHGQGLVVNNQTIIGAGCVLRQGVTLGNKGTPGTAAECPVLEDGVVVGSNAVILGPLRIGKGAVVAAGAVVVKDVPPGAVVGGNPARVIREGPAETPAGEEETPAGDE